MSYKALTLRNPTASRLLLGCYEVLVMDVSTAHRGPVVICADWPDRRSGSYQPATQNDGVIDAPGMLIGIAELYGCAPPAEVDIPGDDWLDARQHRGSSGAAWLLKEHRVFLEPAAPRRAGRWNYEPLSELAPACVVAAIESALPPEYYRQKLRLRAEERAMDLDPEAAR